MSEGNDIAPDSERELILKRTLNARRQNVYRAWTDAAILPLWFAPKPWTTTKVQLDVRPGGASLVVMAGPDGTEFPNRGVYLEVVENERLVFTDAFSGAWIPSAKPFMTAIFTFEDAGAGKTNYTARVMHWTVEDRIAHEKMGFHEGWGICTSQLEEIASTL